MNDKKYTGLITSEHYKKPKFMEWVKAGINYLDSVCIVSGFIGTEFDIDKALGIQLDIIGDIVGVKRTLSFQPLDYSAVLDDEMYRLMIKARIIANQWDGTIPGIQELWSNIFREYPLSIVDNQDMSMKVSVYGNPSDFVQEITSHGYVVPKPSGVRINYEFIHDYLLNKETINIAGAFGSSMFTYLPNLNPIEFSKELGIAGMFSSLIDLPLPNLNPMSFSSMFNTNGLFASVLNTNLPEIGWR